MARRVVDRRQLRAEADEAARALAARPVETAPSGGPALARAPRRPRKARAPKAPARMRAFWGVFDNGMKQVAVFRYNQRAEADARLAELNTRKGGTHFLQVVKLPLEPDPPLPAGAAAMS